MSSNSDDDTWILHTFVMISFISLSVFKFYIQSKKEISTFYGSGT